MENQIEKRNLYTLDFDEKKNDFTLTSGIKVKALGATANQYAGIEFFINKGDEQQLAACILASSCIIGEDSIAHYASDYGSSYSNTCSVLALKSNNENEIDCDIIFVATDKLEFCSCNSGKKLLGTEDIVDEKEVVRTQVFSLANNVPGANLQFKDENAKALTITRAGNSLYLELLNAELNDSLISTAKALNLVPLEKQGGG